MKNSATLLILYLVGALVPLGAGIVMNNPLLFVAAAVVAMVGIILFLRARRGEL